MADQRVLVVDDEPGMLEVCRDTLRRLDNTEVLTELDPLRAAEHLKEEAFDLLVTDIRMPGMDGTELLQLARKHDPGLLVLMLTAFPTVDTAVSSMKLGASDYITKPFLPEDLVATVARLLEQRRLQEENRLLQRQVERPWQFGDIIGTGAEIQKVRHSISRICQADTDVLIMGETGTGKELVARAIHQGSHRGAEHFVPVDCRAIPEETAESEFFGYEQNISNRAVTRRMGLLEFANKGTFFLDGIGELPARLQTRLLRFLQERRIRRVGSNREIPLDVRVIAATSRNLEQEVREDRFRADLFYRINVVRLELPPLRQHPEDVPLLIAHFAKSYAEEMGKKTPSVDPEAMEWLEAYAWPGNVRELQNVVRRMLTMSQTSALTVLDLPDEIVSGETRPNATRQGGFYALRDKRLESFEKEQLSNSLRAAGGNVCSAARDARLPHSTFYRLLKKHGLNPDDFRQ